MNQDDHAAAPGAIARGRAWAWGITGAYCLFALLTLGVVLFAYTRSVDLVSDDYYQREIEHQTRIDAVARTRALGVDWDILRADGVLHFAFPQGHFRSALEGRIHFYRPDDASLDRDVAIALDADGHQDVAADLAPGLWRVRIEWHADGLDFFSEHELRI